MMRGTKADARARLAAVALGVMCAVGVVVIAVYDRRLRLADRSDLGLFGVDDLPMLAALLSATSIGAVLIVRLPRHPVGWCFSGLGLSITVAGAAQSVASLGLLVDSRSTAFATWAALVASYQYIVWFVLVGLICAWTPDGRVLGPRWSRALVVMVASGSAWFTTSIFSARSMEHPFEAYISPLAVTAVDTDVVGWVAAPLTSLLVVAFAAALLVRFRRGAPDTRRRLRWLAVAAVPMPAVMTLLWWASATSNDNLVELGVALLLLLLPVSTALAIGRYRLYDIDRILARTVSYTLVSGLLLCTFAAVVFAMAAIGGRQVGRSSTAGVVATLAAVGIARPVHLAVQDVVDRRFARRRYEGLRLVSAFAASPDPDRPIQDVLRRALDDETVAVRYLVDGSWVDEAGVAGVATPDDRCTDLERDGEVYARVWHAAPPSRARETIRIVAPEIENRVLRASLAVQMVELRASRARIVEAQARERRRIERDLHDGAQQRLLGAAAQLRSALMNGTPERMRAALEFGVGECRNAVTELRELANGLQPALLADRGLPAVLEELAMRSSVDVRIDGLERRPALHIEETAWFVIREAVANAVKHARVDAIAVALRHEAGSLFVEVTDRGCGGADRSGPGLQGLADRVGAAGGALAIASPPGAGTSVRAVLPCGW